MKPTDPRYIEIVERLRCGGESQVEIAQSLGLHPITVYRVKRAAGFYIAPVRRDDFSGPVSFAPCIHGKLCDECWAERAMKWIDRGGDANV